MTSSTQSVSSAVILLTVPIKSLEGIITLPSVDEHTLNITWQPPSTPNGHITRYNIDIRNAKNDPNQYPFYSFNVSAVDEQKHYTLLANGLG